jgi:hypothetical protein
MTVAASCKNNAARKPYDMILKFKIVVLQSLHNLSDESAGWSSSSGWQLRPLECAHAWNCVASCRAPRSYRPRVKTAPFGDSPRHEHCTPLAQVGIIRGSQLNKNHKLNIKGRLKGQGQIESMSVPLMSLARCKHASTDPSRHPY